MIRSSLALICLVSACGRTQSSPIAVVLDSLVPGTRIGARANPVAQKFSLAVEPFFGYSDTNYRAASGIRGLFLQVDEHLSSADRPSDSARIARVMLDFDSRQAATSTLEVLTRKLGPPERFCYKPADKSLHVALYFWPDRQADGLLLMIPLQSSRLPAILTFGSVRPELHPDFKSARRGGCDAA